MPETRGQKRAAIESLNPLYYPDILRSVLCYAGPEQWLFSGLVSRKWAAAYRKVPPATEHEPPCVTITSRVQAFASASRVKFAYKHLGWQSLFRTVLLPMAAMKIGAVVERESWGGLVASSMLNS
jgi:hypothetical protein